MSLCLSNKTSHLQTTQLAIIFIEEETADSGLIYKMPIFKNLLLLSNKMKNSKSV